MNFLELKQVLETNLFSLSDVKKHFPDQKDHNINVQLSRFMKRGLIQPLKQGMYCFDLQKVDEFVLANRLYRPSYISLETALHYYGIIPDVSQKTTSVNPITSKKYTTTVGSFIYRKIKQELFWGYKKEESSGAEEYFLIAEKEKALLDYFYLQRIKNTAGLRLNLREFDFKKYKIYLNQYPNWVKKIEVENE